MVRFGWNFSAFILNGLANECIEFTVIFQNIQGVSHADEVLYMFPRRETIFPHSLPTKEDEEIREAILQLFVDFARTG